MSELEEIKKKKLKELQSQLANEQQQQIKEKVELQHQIEYLENIARQYLTKEAISRYGNVKTAHPEKAVQVIAIIAQAVSNGQLKEKITDEQFKQLLQNLEKPKKDYKILK